MAFSRPTFTQILNRVQADINGRLPGSDARLRRSVLGILAYMVAGVSHTLHGFLIFISRQVFPDTAETEYLERWGRIWGVLRKTATKATGSLVATGANGSVIPSGAQLQRSDGTLFLTTAEATIVSGIATVLLEAEKAGDFGNTTGSSLLNFVSPPPGINATGTITPLGLTGGTDTEADTDYLLRILARIRFPPHGGAENDYKAWALEVPGVTRTWIYPRQDGAGNPKAAYVTTRFMMDNSYVDGIPLPLDVVAVREYIEKKRPVTAKIIVLAPVAQPLNFTIQLTSNDTSSTRAAVQAELQDMILRDGKPSGTLYLSRINAAISSASGQFDHILIAPTTNIVYGVGRIPIFGTITWVPASNGH